MDRSKHSISPNDLYARLGTDAAPIVDDVRRGALDHLATIVRGADTSRHDLSPQCGDLFAIWLGLSANSPDDDEMLKHGAPLP